jgi:hypothetical protein
LENFPFCSAPEKIQFYGPAASALRTGLEKFGLAKPPVLDLKWHQAITRASMQTTTGKIGL